MNLEQAMKQDFPLSKVYGLLETGPVVLITTAWNGMRDVMTQSWHMMIEFEPPIVACVVSDANYSFGLLDGSGECAINIPTFEMAEKVVGCGNSSGRDIDKFEVFSLKSEKASLISAPLIDECYANLECRVIDRMPVYGLFILEVLKAWMNPEAKAPRTMHHKGHGEFMIAGETVTLPSKMK
ncbi:MAG TPA: flavin reductase family protein [Burkholderiales bacterium]|nr:flavin reductase family protein [Burkholderiales bacterium]